MKLALFDVNEWLRQMKLRQMLMQMRPGPWRLRQMLMLEQTLIHLPKLQQMKLRLEQTHYQKQLLKLGRLKLMLRRGQQMRYQKQRRLMEHVQKQMQMNKKPYQTQLVRQMPMPKMTLEQQKHFQMRLAQLMLMHYQKQQLIEKLEQQMRKQLMGLLLKYCPMLVL